VAHVPGKGDGNALPFTVRAGAIYFVSASGSDSNDGSFANPWKTIPKAKNSILAGTSPTSAQAPVTHSRKPWRILHRLIAARSA